MTGAVQRPRLPALVVVTLWRLAVAGLALASVAPYVEDYSDLRFLSTTGNLVVALYFAYLAAYPFVTRLRRSEPRSAGVRGAVVVTILLVGLTYTIYLQGPLEPWQRLTGHVVVPALALADWLLVGRSQAQLRWWHPLAWLAYPLAYLAFVLVYAAAADGYYPYGSMLDPASPQFPVTIVAFLVVLLALGYLLLGLGRLRRASSGAKRSPEPAR